MAGIRAYTRDRRWIAVHEAGHVIAARQFGADAFGMIWSVGDHWEGGTDIPTIDAMPADQRRVIGLAGAAALMLWLGIPAERFFSMNVGMSVSDWKLIGLVTGRSNVAVLRDALAFALALLGRERMALLTTARALIIGSRAADQIVRPRLDVSENRLRCLLP